MHAQDDLYLCILHMLEGSFLLNAACILQFIEYYTLFTKERMEENEEKKRKVEIKEDARKKKEVERRQKNSQKNQTRKEENKNAIKLKKMNPHAAYGNVQHI